MGCDFHHCNKVKNNNNKVMDPRHHFENQWFKQSCQKFDHQALF